MGLRKYFLLKYFSFYATGGLGLKPKKDYEVDYKFFEEFKNLK